MGPWCLPKIALLEKVLPLVATADTTAAGAATAGCSGLLTCGASVRAESNSFRVPDGRPGQGLGSPSSRDGVETARRSELPAVRLSISVQLTTETRWNAPARLIKPRLAGVLGLDALLKQGRPSPAHTSYSPPV